MSIQTSTKASNFRAYLIFWSGQQVSQIGSAIVQFAIIWWITITTQSGFYLAIATFLGIGSQLLTQFVAGAIVDRYNRKIIIFVTDFLQALASFYLLYLFYLNLAAINDILLVLTLRGLFGGFHGPATNAIIPVMVPQDKLKQMNSLSSLTSSLLNIFTPTLSALILAIFGLENLHLILSIDVITFLVAFIALLIVHIPPLEKPAKGEEKSFREDLTLGWKYIRNGPGFLPLLFTFAVINFFLTPSIALVPLIVNSPYGLSGDEFTLALALGLLQVGSILGSLIFTRNKVNLSLLGGLYFGIILLNISLFFLGLSGYMGHLVGFLVFMFFNGCGVAIANIHSRTMWQTYVPLHLQGRVFSVRIALASLISPISLIIFGILSELINPSLLIMTAGLTSFILFFVAWYGTSIRHIQNNLDKMQTNDELAEKVAKPHKFLKNDDSLNNGISSDKENYENDKIEKKLIEKAKIDK